MLSDSANCTVLRAVVLTQYWRATDGRTDGIAVASTALAKRCAVKTAYQYVLDLHERIEETCQLAQEEIAKVQKIKQTYYNRRARERRLNIGDSVLLLLPTENNKLTLAWRGPYKVVEKVGEVELE